MKKVNRTEDIIDIMQGEIDLVKSVRYFTHTEPEKKIEPIIEEDGDMLIARIPASELAKLKDGQLMCLVKLESEDSGFTDDDTYNIQLTEGLSIWLK